VKGVEKGEQEEEVVKSVRGVQKPTADNLKFVWDEFLTLS
jgi:hypothetical protein